MCILNGIGKYLLVKSFHVNLTRRWLEVLREVECFHFDMVIVIEEKRGGGRRPSVVNER